MPGEALRNFANGQKWRLMKAAHRHDFGECLLLGVEPPFPTDACASLEARLSLFHIYFSDRLPGVASGCAGFLETKLSSSRLLDPIPVFIEKTEESPPLTPSGCHGQ